MNLTIISLLDKIHELRPELRCGLILSIGNRYANSIFNHVGRDIYHTPDNELEIGLTKVYIELKGIE